MNQMQSSDAGWAPTPYALLDATVDAIPDQDVFFRTPSGAQAAGSVQTDLPGRLRMLLFLINGRRRMSEYRDLLPRYRGLDDTFDLLLRKGYIQRAGEAASR